MELVPRLEFMERDGYVVSRKEQTIEIFQPVLADVFPGQWLLARCVIAKPFGIIPIHRDNQDSGPWKLLVVQTNRDAWSFHGGDWQQLEQDGIYEADQQVIHGAVNFGKEPRVHLVVGTAKDE